MSGGGVQRTLVSSLSSCRRSRVRSSQPKLPKLRARTSGPTSGRACSTSVSHPVFDQIRAFAYRQPKTLHAESRRSRRICGIGRPRRSIAQSIAPPIQATQHHHARIDRGSFAIRFRTPIPPSVRDQTRRRCAVSTRSNRPASSNVFLEGGRQPSAPSHRADAHSDRETPLTLFWGSIQGRWIHEVSNTHQ